MINDLKVKEDMAHRWQSFRITCLKLALKGGATDQNMIEIADKLGAYILTKSKIEIGATAQALQQREGQS